MKYLIMLVLLLGMLTLRSDAPPAEAGLLDPRQWKEGEIDDVKKKVTDIESSVNGSTGLMFRTSNLPTRLTNIEAMIPSVNGADGLVDRTENLREVMQRVQDQRAKVTPEMLDAIDDALEVLQQNITEDRDGLAAFRGSSGDCTSVECMQFRGDLATLLTNMENLSNTLVELDPGIGVSAQIDLTRLRNIFQSLPSAGLYPLYRATSRDTDLFGSGIIPLLGDMEAKVLVVKDGIQSNIPRPGQCSYIMGDPDQFATAASAVRGGGKVLILMGKVFDAWGSTYVSGKPVQVHGYVGIAVENNFRKSLGLFLQGQGDNLLEVSSTAHDNLRYCTLLDAREQILANQQSILEGIAGCELEIAAEGIKGNSFHFFVLTTLQGERQDPTDVNVWVGSQAVAPIGGTPASVVPGVQRVELDSKELPSGQSVPLTVEAGVSGHMCSGISVVQRGAGAGR